MKYSVHYFIDQIRMFECLSTGEAVMSTVDSWTRCEDLCAAVLSSRGVAESHGWTIAVDEVGERNGLDYVLDAISEMELPPAFPVHKPVPLISTKVN